MHLFDYIKQLNNFENLLSSSSIVCFRYPQQTYPVLFLSYLFTLVQKHCIVQSVDVSEISQFMDINVKISGSFLGLPIVYILRHVDKLDVYKQKDLFKLLTVYKGPNYLFIALPDSIDIPKTGTDWLVIDIPQKVNQDFFISLIHCLHQKHALQRIYQHTKELFIVYKEIPFESACLLIHYLILMGFDRKEFMQSWLMRLVVQDSSFFQLSHTFFAQDEDSFFKLWASMYGLYSSQFWLSFWMEQLWRAACFTSFAQKQAYAEAKKIAFRLPFSFMQKDWKKYTILELKQAHNFLYQLDGKLKSGTHEHALDLFFFKFFQRQFAHSSIK